MLFCYADRSLAVTQAPALWMLAFDTPDKSKKAGGPQEKQKITCCFVMLFRLEAEAKEAPTKEAPDKYTIL